MAEATVGWGILGAGRIAEAFVAAIADSQRGRLVAVGSRTPARASELAARVDPPARHGSYDDVLGDPRVDVVYIATPHPDHIGLVIRAANAHKHVLCEKPFTMTAEEAVRAVESARAAGIFLMESFKYRCHPQMQALRDLIASGVIGVPSQIQAVCAFSADYDPADRLFDPGRGGGAILDVGCYPVSLARLVAGAWLGDDAIEPVWVQGRASYAETGVDVWSVGTFAFPSGITAQLRTGSQLRHAEELRIYGERGYIVVDRPLSAGGKERPGTITVGEIGKGEPRQLHFEAAPPFVLQIDLVNDNLGHSEAACMPWKDSIANMATLERWLEAVRSAPTNPSLQSAEP